MKGGAKNHAAVLELFGKHLVGQEIKPEEIEKKRYKLNELRDGMLEPFEDWSSHGIEKIRLRRARFSPKSTTGVAFQIEASPDKDQDDAIKLGLDTLKIHHSFETEYNLDGGSVVVIMETEQGQKSKSFSFRGWRRPGFARTTCFDDLRRLNRERFESCRTSCIDF
ncbi:hypothetical protein BCM14_0760 [Jezberella montanilacus]|uniref:Uncharacterized protein n=1 Tax=Jezberella montanilacus TaxID=323426 RepID=A0A2T0XK53_9BURK|nr:hypothetical protein BCM14_0760 [Jezberella montanilacus]